MIFFWKSISENIRKDKGHSRNASNASSTSLEVAQITAGDIGNEIKEEEENSITDTVPFNMGEDRFGILLHH